jgi:hypothetical protein
MSSSDDPAKPEHLIAAAIDAAEEIHDALDGLVERITDDPGAAFTPNVLEALAALIKMIGRLSRSFARTSRKLAAG